MDAEWLSLWTWTQQIQGITAVNHGITVFYGCVSCFSRIIEFIVRVGSSSSSGTCDYGDSTDEGVVAMFSTNGGISWTRLAIFSYYGYRSVTTYRSALPSAARSSSTRFGWWQPFNSGDNQDEWAIDDVFIGGEDINPTSMYETFDPISQGSWLFYNGGIVNGYCNSGRHALVFR